MIHSGNKLDFCIKTGICVVALAVLCLAIKYNNTSIKDIHKQQQEYGVQQVLNETNNFISNTKSTIFNAIATTDSKNGINISKVNKLLDEHEILLLGGTQNIDGLIISTKSNTNLPITMLQCRNKELWVCSQILIENGSFIYTYKLSKLQNYINNICNNVIVIQPLNSTFPADCITKLSSNDELTDFIVKNNVEVDKFHGKFDLIPCTQLVNTNNKAIANCFIGVCLEPISSSINAAKLQNLVTILLLVVIGLLLPFLFTKWKRTHDRKRKFGNLLSQVDFQQIINSATDGVRIIDLDYRIAAVNKAFTQITGFNEETATNQKCYDCYKSLMCHTADCPLERIIEGENNIEQTEYRFNSEGQKQKCAFNTSPLYNSKGELIGVVERFKEVENTEVENKLKRTEQLFEIFIDNLPVGVFIEDGISHNISFQNTYINQITGGVEFNTFIKDANFNSQIDEGYNKEEQVRLIDHNGQIRYFKFHKFKFLGVNRQLQHGGLLIDITKRKDIEKLRNVLSMAVENTLVSIVILSQSTKIEYTNPLFIKLVGYDYNQIIGKNILDLGLEPNQHTNISRAITEIKNGNAWRGEFQIKSNNNELTWIYASFIPVADEHNYRTIIIIEDISVRKEREKEILIAKKKAEESDKLKSSFLSNLSHEIRTPLNAIIGFASLLSDNELSQNERNNLSEIIYHNSNGLLHIIENIIEISEIESNQISISKKEFSIDSLLYEIYQETINEEQKNANVKLNVMNSAGDITICSDKSRIKQVLLHLLNNACKFTEQGFIEFGAAIGKDNTMLFYVIDSGIGIEADKQAVIFNPFRQADESSTRRFGGMGLGLAISKHIIEKLGGRIWVNSALDSGTSVYFTIPYIQNVPESKPQNNDFTNYQWGNKTILVADDIDANFDILKSALKKTCAQILWAKTGDEAVDIVKNSPDIDLILMDIRMPRMNGLEATRTIKDFNSEIPIIAQTAYTSELSQSSAKEYGFESVLEKPLNINKMLMEIDRYFRN